MTFDFTPSVPPVLPSFSMDPGSNLPACSLLTFGLSTFGVRAHCPQVTERPGGPRSLQLSTKWLHGLTEDSVVSTWQQFQNRAWPLYNKSPGKMRRSGRWGATVPSFCLLLPCVPSAGGRCWKSHAGKCLVGAGMGDGALLACSSCGLRMPSLFGQADHLPAAPGIEQAA